MLQKALDICIETMVVPLELWILILVVQILSWNLFVFSDFSFIIILKQIKTFPYEH